MNMFWHASVGHGVKNRAKEVIYIGNDKIVKITFTISVIKTMIRRVKINSSKNFSIL